MTGNAASVAEGYTATDILARYKRMKGFNVLHPIAWDAFGLPAEQYALQTGTHPAVTTQCNINRFREQLQSLGGPLHGSQAVHAWHNDCSSGVFVGQNANGAHVTSCTQVLLHHVLIEADRQPSTPKSGSCTGVQCSVGAARSSSKDTVHLLTFALVGCSFGLLAGLSYDWDREFSTTDPEYYKWTQWIFLQLHKRGLAYQAEVPVNWCPELGTVLANEEVIDGKSERGGFPVVRLPMKQVSLV